MGLYKLTACLAAALSLFACNREPSVRVETETFKARLAKEDAPTKADIGATGQFTWAAGDKIAVWYESTTYQFSHYYDAVLTSGAGSGTATFRIDKNGERTGYALYPSNIADNRYPGLDAHRLRVVLPDEYELSAGAPSNQPMLAQNASGADLVFYHMASMLRLSLSNIPAGTRVLRVSTDKDISGPYRVTFPTSGHPYIEPSENTDPGNHGSVLFIYPEALSAAESRVVDVPVPQGVYSWFRVEALSDDRTTVLSAASFAEEARFMRAQMLPRPLDLSGGASRLVSFGLTKLASSLLPGQSLPVNTSIRQVRAGGGTENASGYTLEAVSVSSPEVVELFVRDNIIRVRGLAPGVATIKVKVSKGNDSLYAQSEVRVASIDGVNVCVDRGEAFTDWYLIIPAQVVSEGREVTSDELFSFEWELLPAGTPLAKLEGSGSTVTLRTLSATGTVTVKCTAKCKSNPSVAFSGESEVSLAEAVGIMKSPFSISSTKQVYFGKANLLKDNTTGEFTLCPDQLYAYLGVEDLTLPPPSAIKRDMFDNEMSSQFGSPYTSSHIFIGAEETSGWQVLSKAEIDYVFLSRTTAAGRASKIGKLSNARYIVAEVDGREGVIIFPDIFVWPSELPAPERVNAAVSPSTNRYTRAEWNKYLETAGAVFLVGGMYGPITSGSAASTMRFDYNNVCYRTRDSGYFWFPLYTGTRYTYNCSASTGDYRYMRVRPVKPIYK